MGMSTICKINGPSLMSVELAQRDLLSRKVKVGHFVRLPTMSLDRGTRIRAFSPSWSTDSWKSKKGHGFKESKQLDAAVKLFESVVTVAVPPQIRTLEKGLGQAAMGKAFVILDGDFDDLNPVDSIQHLISLTSNILSPRHLPYIKIGSVHELGKPAPYEPDLEYSLTRKLRLLCDGDSDLPVKMSLAYLQTIETWNHANNVAYLDDRKIVWTSHECSMLPYEQALTKKDPTTGLYYSCSAHMLWLGEDFADAHVEFLRGISNPIGIKITAASKLSADNLIKLITLLNPDKRPGRITVLTDFPSHLIAAKLPSFIQAVNRAHQIVTWLIHPAADRAMANSASGIAVHDDCKLNFMQLKAKRTHRFIVFKIEQKQVVVEKLGKPSETYEDFSAFLPADECRYAVFDFDFVTAENVPKSKIFFVAWCPDTAKVRGKMIYASSKDRFKRELDGIQVELQATDPSEMDLDVFNSRAH